MPTHSYSELKSINQMEDYGTEKDFFYKNEYANFKKNQKMYSISRDLKYRNYDYNYYHDESVSIFLIIFAILFLCVFSIISIIAPLTFDNIIPIDGLYWLISWVPLMVFTILFLLIYIICALIVQYTPFFSESQFKGETNVKFSIFIASHFLWIFPFLLGIGLKLLIWRNDPVWFWCMLPTTLVIFLNIFNTMATWMFLLKQSPQFYLIFINVLLLNLSFCLGIFLCCFKLDGIWFKMDWSTAFIPFHIIPLILSLLPIELIIIFPEICYIIGSPFISILIAVLTYFWWVTFLLIGLKLDGYINTLFVICFIPWYSIVVFVVLGGLCVGIGYALFCGYCCCC